MVDNVQPPVQDPAPVESGEPKGSSGLKGFAASRNGRIILAVVGALTLLALMGIVAVVFFVMLGGTGTVTVQESAPTGAGSGGSAETTSTNDVAEEPEEVSISEIFVFRDVFEPTVEPAKIPKPQDSGSPTSSPGGGSTSGGTSGGSSSGGSSSSSTSEDTLYLEAVETEDGKSVAVITYNGETYRLTEGEVVSDTPWKVLEIDSNSVIMLYGDTQVTLSIGQGLTK